MSELRGGGCGRSTSVVTPGETTEKPMMLAKRILKLPGDLRANIRMNIEKITSLTESDATILSSLQFFFLNEYAFQMMLDKKEVASQYVDLFQLCISDLLTAVARLVKSNGLFSNLAIQIAHWMCKVLLWFNTSENDKKRKIGEDQVKAFLTQVTQIETELETEKIIHETAIKYELYCIKIIFTIFPNNSEEGKNLAIQFVTGAIESFLSMSPSDNLIASLKGGLKLAIDEGYKLYAKSQYQKIFRIDKLKGEIIDDLRYNPNFQMGVQIKKLSDLYQQIRSSSWEIQYAWIKSITAIICAKPIQSKQNLSLSEQQIKELETQKTILMIDSDNFLVQLNAKKLISFESQQLYSRIPIITNLQEIQLQLLVGNDWIPKFLNYGKIIDDNVKIKQITPKAYFIKIFKNIRFTEFISQVKDINQILEKIERSQICTTLFDVKIIEDFRQIISFIQYQLKNLNSKLVRLSEFYYKIKWISLQWDQFVSENSEPSLYIYEPFFQELVDDQNKLIENIGISEVFKQDQEEFKLNQPITPQQNKQNYSKNQQQMEFIIQVYLRQLFRVGDLHLKNIQNINRISLELDFFLTVINTDSHSSKVLEFILGIQKLITESLKSLAKYPINPILKLQNNLKFITDSDSNIQRNFIIPSIELFNLDLVVQHEKQLKSLLQVIIQSYSETLKQFKSNSIQDTSILTIYIRKIKKDLQDLNFLLQDQETLRIKIFDLYKSVQYQDQRDMSNLQQAQNIFYKELPKIEEIQLDNDLAQSIVNCITLAKDWQKQCNNIYGEILELNPYDQISQTEWDGEIKKIQVTIQYLSLIQDIIKIELEDSILDVKIIIQKIQDQNTTGIDNQRKISDDRSKIEGKKKNEYDGQLKQYEELFKKLKPQLEIRLIEVGKIETTLDIMKRIEQTCNKTDIPINWIQKIKEYQLDDFEDDFDNARITIDYSTQPRINTVTLTDVIDTIFPHDSSQVVKDKTKSSLNNDQIRIKEGIITSLFMIIDSCLQPNIRLEADLMILRMKTYEIDKKLRTLLNSSDYSKQITSILQEHWPSEQEKIVNEVKKGLKDLSTLQYEIQQETDLERKKKLKSDYQIRENEIQEQLQNISEIGSSLGITMLFIKDIKNDLNRMEEKINQIQENVKTITNDLEYLKGKTIYQLLDVRRQDIITKKKMIDAQKVYIKINCSEKMYEKKQEQDSEEKTKGDDLTQTNCGNEETINNELMEEVHKFFDEPKTSLLLHGSAGSGKSTASRKIEEYLWDQYQKTSDKDCKVVPIIIQLPQLQDPLRSAMNETLKSESYRFSDNQIRDLKEEIIQKRIKLVIIMDSYDELSEEARGTNLIGSNKLSMWGRAQFDNYPKVISTTRSEALNSADYKENFLPEEVSNHKPNEQYKEIQILKFDKGQQTEYIEKYLTISVKRILYETYLQMTKNLNELEVFEQFINFWDSIKLNLNVYETHDLLTTDAIKQLQNDLMQDKNIQITSQEIQRNLEVQLGELKSKFFYIETIRIMKIENILETPFMMELVVEVLPSLIKIKSQQAQVKRFFIPKYQELLQNSNTESFSLNAYKAAQAWDDLVQNHKFFENFLITHEDNEIRINLKNNVKNINKETNKKKIKLYLEALKSRNLTQYDFYQSFLSLFFSKTISKQKEHGLVRSSGLLLKEVWRFAKDLAVDMSQHKKTQVEYQVKGLLYDKAKKSWDDDYFDDDGEKGEYKKLFRDCIPLKQLNSSYSFNHKSLQEFLVAKEFIKQMRDVRKSIQEVQSKKEHMNDVELQKVTFQKLRQLQGHFANKQSWSKPFMNGTCAFIVQKGIRKPELRKIMYSAVELTHKDNDPNSEMMYLGSNCLFLLVNMGENFMDKNTQGIRIKEVDLSGANFAYCHLDDSQFTDINISGINLFNTTLNNIKWTKIKVGLYPDIELEDIVPKKMIYTEQGDLIICGKNNEKSEISYCRDATTALIQSHSEIKLHYFQNIIFAQESTNIKCLDAQYIPLILNKEEIQPILIQSTQIINRVRFQEDEIYYLNDQSEIYRCSIKDFADITTKPEIFQISIKNSHEIKEDIENFWLSEQNIMICTKNDFYQLVQQKGSSSIYQAIKLKENIGSTCQYYPKYRLLQTSDEKLHIDKIELIDPTLNEYILQEQKEDELLKKTKNIQIKLNLTDEVLDNTKTSEEQQKDLKAQLQKSKEEQQQQMRLQLRKQQEEPITEQKGIQLKVIELSSMAESFLLWSDCNIKQYSVTIALKEQGTIPHNLGKYIKKHLSNNNKILVTIHKNKVMIWDVGRMEKIQQLEINDVEICVIDKNDILTMYKKDQRKNKEILMQKDLKSETQSMQQQFRKLICTSKSQNFVIETIDGDIYFYQHKGREFNSSLISKEGSKYLQIGTLGQRVLVIKKYQKNLQFWDSQIKSFESTKKYYYAFSNKNIKFRYVNENYEIYFMKANQLYKVENNEATIISPTQVLQKVKTLEKIYKAQEQLLDSFIITNDSIYILMNGHLIQYKLYKGIQQSVKQKQTNITHLIICNNKKQKQTIYYVVNKNRVHKDSIEDQPIYVTKEEITGIIHLEDENDLAISHISCVRRLTITTDIVQYKSIAIQNSTWLFYSNIYLFIGLKNTIQIYNLELNTNFISIDFQNENPGKMCSYIFSNQYAVLCNKKIYTFKCSRNAQPQIQQKQGDDCLDIFSDRDVLFIRNSKGIQYVFSEDRDVDEGRFFGPFFIKFNEQWDHIQLVVLKDRFYIYGIHKYQIVRRSFTHRQNDTQVMGSLIQEYELVKGFDLSHQYLIYYTQSNVYIKDLDNAKQLEIKMNCIEGTKMIAICSSNKYLITSNLLDKIYIYNIQDAYKDPNKEPTCIEQFESIDKLLFVQEKLLVFNNQHLFIVDCDQIKSPPEKVANMKQSFRDISATETGFNILNKDHSIDIYQKQKQTNKSKDGKITKDEKYVRVQVFNSSSNQSINSGCEYAGAVITSSNGFNLSKLLQADQ